MDMNNDRDRDIPDRLIRAKEVSRITGLGLSTVYKYVKAGHFPGSFEITPRSKAWSLNAVNQWVADRKAGLPAAEGFQPVKAASIREAVRMPRPQPRRESR